MDLKLLASLIEQPPIADGIWAPSWVSEQASKGLPEAIARLREAGERVVQALPGQSTGPEEHRCNRCLEETPEGWQIFPLT